MLNRSHSRGRAAIALAAVATAAGLLVAGLTSHAAAASGQAGQAKAETLRLVARQDTFQFVDNQPAGDSAGDLVVTSDKVYDRGGHRQLGRDHIAGIETVPGKSIALTGTLVLAHGEIALQGVTNEQNDRPFQLAITGGTGAYRDATGTATVVPISRTLSRMTLSIRG